MITIRCYLDNDNWDDNTYEDTKPIDLILTKDDIEELMYKKHELQKGTFINELEIITK